METKEYNAFKTAIKRNNKLSAPMKVLYDKGLLKGKILDYGCGFGEDVNKLKNLGYNIVGYDKYNTKFKIDFLLDKMYSVVTCNYVFNVIQKNEHDKLLKLLKSLGDEIYISVRADKKAIKHNWVYDKDKDVYITTHFMLDYKKNNLILFSSITELCQVFLSYFITSSRLWVQSWVYHRCFRNN